MVIAKSGSGYVLKSPRSGRVLGRHRTKTAAKRQDVAIRLSKLRAKGEKIPKKRKRR